MTNRTHRRWTTMLIAAGCLLVSGCGTAQTSLTDQETTSLGPARCPGGTLQGAGSRVQHDAIDQVAQNYGTRCDDEGNVSYTATDSAAGVASFLAGSVDWAGTETPLTEDQQAAAASRCTAGEAWSLPLVAGPIAIVVNLPGIDQLTLSAPVLGAVFQGTITHWDDPAIAALNPDLTLPAEPITVISRAGEDGLTGGLTRYLAAFDAWPEDAVGETWSGVGERLDRPTGLSALRGTAYSVGYVEFSAARNNELSVARLDSGTGPVQLTEESAAAGLASADLTGSGGNLVLTPNYADARAGAYPLQVVSYQVVCTTGLTPASRMLLLRDFMGFLASDQQQAALGELGYSPLPTEAREPLREAIAEIS